MSLDLTFVVIICFGSRNITLKDAPCELSNQVICAFMQQFGDVVQGSLRRDMIKGTNIETAKTVTIQFFSVICMDCIKKFSASFSISSKTSLCAIPFVKLVLRCTDKCLWI
jgi:hypothetical protein